MPAVPCSLFRSSAPEVDQSPFIILGNQSRIRDLTARNSANLPRLCQSVSPELFSSSRKTLFADGVPRSSNAASLIEFSARINWHSFWSCLGEGSPSKELRKSSKACVSLQFVIYIYLSRNVLGWPLTCRQYIAILPPARTERNKGNQNDCRTN